MDDRATELADAFSRFGPAFMRWVRAGVEEEGLTFARMRLMWAVHTEGPQIMSELKDWLGVTARSVSSLVDALEDEGYVRRRLHPEDKRAHLVELTDEGETVVERAHRTHRDRASDLFASLGEDEQDQLLATMEKLLAEIDARG
jgi:DNA-binding MarR family transcriptional regulator